MSNETNEWLDNNVLVGFTDKRGNAWHWREGTDNHYPDAIPVEEVKRRLFDWEPVKIETVYTHGDIISPTGEFIYVNSKTSRKIAATTETHQAHPYSEWLLRNVGNILDDDLKIGSAGLLRNGAVAWVQVELTETMHSGGVAFRPNLLATTSLDQSVRSTYKTVNTIVVCDNTLAMAFGEDTAAYAVKHTKNSRFEVLPAREKIGLQLKAQAETFSAELDRMTSTTVTAEQFQRFLDKVTPVSDGKGRAQTIAMNKQDRLNEMYTSDPRVALWKGTVWGVLQLMNTYNTHEATFKGGNRAETNMINIITGRTDVKDKETLDALQLVMVAAH